MTRIITLLIAILLLAGCSNKGFHKRQYKNRMWINHGFTKTEKEAVNKNTQPEEKSTPVLRKLTLEFEDLELEKEEAHKSSEEPTVNSSPNQKPEKESSTPVLLKDETENTVYTVSEGEISHAPAELRKKKDGQQTNHSGIAILLLVIIALLIPPLAVLLYEGATNRFLLNLLLSLLYLLVFVNPLAALCGLLAVIHAVLIVIGAI